MAHVAATDACVTASDARRARRRDPFTLLEVVVAGHNVVLDYQADGLECGDPDAIAPVSAGDGRVARLSPVGLGDVDVEVLNLEDDSSMGLYTGPDPDAVSPEGLVAPLAGGPSPTCSMGGAIQAWYGRANGSSAQINVCTEWGVICTFATPTGNYFYIYGNGSPNLMHYGFHWCGTPGYPPYAGGFDPSWTAYPRLYGYGGVDTLLSGSPLHSVLYGGDGDDTLVGADGQDYLYGEAGDDTLIGHGDTDRLYGGTEDDTLEGEDGVDYLYGQGGCDSLYAGLGDDFSDGGPGNDYVSGDHFDSVYNDTVLGGGGYDFLDFANYCDGQDPAENTSQFLWSCEDDFGDWCCGSCMICVNAQRTGF